MNSGLRASVVIPVRGRPELLALCLTRVCDQTLDRDCYEVIVCDDGSAAREGSAIANHCEQFGARYRRQPPKGPAAARNLGIRAARADIIAFTDSDTLPTRDWLRALVEPFSDSTVVAVEGPVRTPRPAASPLEEAPRNEGGACLTANMAYRREALWKVGGLDENYPLAAFEDTELALACRSLGRFVFAPDALVIHPWRRMTWTASVRRLRQFDWLLVTALRYGCLGWETRPTRWPRTRVILAAAVTLPLGRGRKGATFFSKAPLDALQRIALSIVESAVALAISPRWIRRVQPIPRRSSLMDRAA